MTDSVADPRCALFDETGTRVLCMRQGPGDARCIEPLARLYMLYDDWGNCYRTLVFPHDEWAERGGVWRETERARKLRAKGRRPGPRHNVLGGARDEHGAGSEIARWLGACPTHWPRSYPTFVRCPDCWNKRLLHADVLGVVSLRGVARSVTDRAEAKGIKGGWWPCFLRDDTGRQVGLIRRARAFAALLEVERLRARQRSLTTGAGGDQLPPREVLDHLLREADLAVSG